MNAQRITVLVVLALVAVYVAIVHQANPVPIALPGLLSLPLWLILLGTGLLAYLAGWLPGAIRTWRLRRERGRLERRIAELESHLPSYDAQRSEPIIPDRAAAPASTSRTRDDDDAPDPSA